MGYDDDSVMILADTVAFLFVPVAGIGGIVSGSGTGKFRPEYCFHLPCIFPAGSVVIRTGNGGKSLE